MITLPAQHFRAPRDASNKDHPFVTRFEGNTPRCVCCDQGGPEVVLVGDSVFLPEHFARLFANEWGHLELAIRQSSEAYDKIVHSLTEGRFALPPLLEQHGQVIPKKAAKDYQTAVRWLSESEASIRTRTGHWNSRLTDCDAADLLPLMREIRDSIENVTIEEAS